MPPRPRVPHLPPLPPPSTWSTHFPRRLLGLSRSEPAKVLRGRTLLASKDHCDAFVRELGIRPGEVIIEVNPGPGQLTRSLLDGGVRENEEGAWKALDEIRGVKHKEVENKKKPGAQSARSKAKERASEAAAAEEAREAVDGWPSWPKTTSGGTGSAESSETVPTAGNDHIKPALVAVSEPSPAILERGFGFETSNSNSYLEPSEREPGHSILPTPNKYTFFQIDHVSWPMNVTQSEHHPNLILSESSAYRWPTLPEILSDPLVLPYVEKMTPDAQKAGQAGRRKWDAEEPPITVVVTIPDSVIGEQMLAQWIGSVVGATDGRHWIWQYGRVRLAVLCGKGLYDRIMARPRETINCKLSIMTSSLFHRRPLPPYHHVPNVDKSSKRVAGSPITSGRLRSSPAVQALIDPSEGNWTQDPTITYPTDFFPPSIPANSRDPLPRPTLLGICLTPRLTSPVLPHQKDAWDFVLRNCFIRETQPISEATTNLGFGAENLLERFEDEKEGYRERWRGEPVGGKTKVKDLSNEQWARVVDVFDKWAFKPETLMLATDAIDGSRELGVD